MDRKSFLILGVAILVLLMLSGLVNRIFPPIQVPVTSLTTNQAAIQTTNPQTPQPVGTNVEASTNALPAAPTNPPPPEVTLTVSYKDLIFHFTSYGGGLKQISLRDTNYPAVVH